jgi:hypothetical protein
LSRCARLRAVALLALDTHIALEAIGDHQSVPIVVYASR